MKDLSQIEVHLNKTTNTIRIFSVIIICTTSAFILGLSIGENLFSNTIIVFISLFFGAGFSLMIASEILWKIIKKYGSTEERLFYFYNLDKKRYE